MINEEIKTNFQNVIYPYILRIQKWIESNSPETLLLGSYLPNVRANNQGIIIGSVSYFLKGDQNKDSIDLVFDFHYTSQRLNVMIDIAMSNGKVITELTQKEIPFTSLEDVYEKVSTVMDEEWVRAQELFLEEIKRKNKDNNLV